MDWEKIVRVSAAVGGAIAGLFGGWDALLLVLLAFMAIDYATGWMVGFIGKSPKTETGHLDSKEGWKGVFKKTGELLAVIVAVLLDMVAVSYLGYGVAIFRTAMILYIMATEGLSILENLGLLGVPLPAFIIKALEQVQKSNETAGEIVQVDQQENE